jgi:ribosomal protein S18 acetylase RimI-like enzyme
MPRHLIREATLTDVPLMASLRDKSGWSGSANAERMKMYLSNEHDPQYALSRRIAFIAVQNDTLRGYVAGHLTTRFGCQGELQWILVDPDCRGSPIASELLTRMAEWSFRNESKRVCVNVEPENVRARAFYRRLGAVKLSEYWLQWPDISEVQKRHDEPTDALNSPVGRQFKS